MGDEGPGARAGGRLGWAISLVLLAVIVGGGLYVRLKNNDYGLPYVYNYDEASHFTNRAVSFFNGDLNPGYFQNPSAFTYIVFIVLKLFFGVFGLHLSESSVSRQFAYDPTPIWVAARATAAGLAVLGVIGLFAAGTSLWRDRRVGLVAAAILSFAFLPVIYGRIAVTDVGTFLPIALATWATLRAYENGRWWQYLLAGAGVGFAVGFKYTAGLALLPLIVVAGVRAWRDRDTAWLRRMDLRWLVAAVFVMVVAFAITTPYFFLKPISALYQLKQQAEAAGQTEKLGQSQQGGISYYLESMTWGFGYVASALALVGAFFEFRRDRLRGFLLVLYPVVLFLYMGIQTRYFGRWLLPMYPVLCLLAGVGVVRLAELVPVPGRRRLVQGLIVAALTGVTLIQPLIHDFRTDAVEGRTDTRDLARQFIVDHYPRSLRVVLEPAVPDNFYRVKNQKTRQRQFVRGFIRDIRRQANLDAPDGITTTYASTLNPQAIDQYRSKGFCLVATMSLIRGRAENAKVPEALAYYKRLERESKLVYHVSPFKQGAKPVPLHFDFSYNYYDAAYERPGPEVSVYQLNNCHQQTGKVPNQPVGTKGLDKGIGSSFVAGAN